MRHDGGTEVADHAHRRCQYPGLAAAGLRGAATLFRARCGRRLGAACGSRDIGCAPRSRRAFCGCAASRRWRLRSGRDKRGEQAVQGSGLGTRQSRGRGSARRRGDLRPQQCVTRAGIHRQRRVRARRDRRGRDIAGRAARGSTPRIRAGSQPGRQDGTSSCGGRPVHCRTGDPRGRHVAHTA